MLAWMRSFGELRRIGVESTGSYGAGLLRFMRQPGLRFWRSQPPTSRIDADVARTTISMLRMQPMPPLQANGP